MNRQKILTLVACAAVLVGLLAVGSVVRAEPAVFINEIHYDNASTDAGEAVEIAGPAGTDLTAWTLVLYNGNGGADYDTIVLNGTLPDLGGGHGVLSFATTGLQNGAPDGLALVDASSAVVQFLSYEGSFVAVGGPADGMSSEDIGVSEGSSTPVGASLQLTGTGTTYTDFTWTAVDTNTFGAFNTGQSFGGVAAPDLVINEIDYDQPGTDYAEFVEIRNNGASTADLTGVSLVLVNGNGTSVYNTIDLSGYTLDAGDYFVVCGDATMVSNCDLDVSPDSNLIQNGAPDAVAL
ncbi:MAG: lamin tail domain-containing protein, partial [Anaerolineales bacterium]